MKPLFTVLLFLMTIVPGLAAESYAATKAKAPASVNILKEYRFIAHALGGIDGNKYTNGPEAFRLNYKRGMRIFEVDLSLTKDGELVCYHPGLEKQIGADRDITQLTKKEFMSKRMFNKYTLLSLDGLLRLMKEHKDVYIMTDTKHDIGTSFNKICERANAIDKGLLDRIIPQIYKPEDYDTVIKLHRFKWVVFTLYKSKLSDDKVVSFAREKKLSAVTVSTSRFNASLVKRLAQYGIPVFVHTINDPEKIKAYRSQGVYGFYTDFYEE